MSEAWSLAPQDEWFGIVHGDYRLDNLLFAPDGFDGAPVTAIGWQTSSLGLPAHDLAYLIGTGSRSMIGAWSSDRVPPCAISARSLVARRG